MAHIEMSRPHAATPENLRDAVRQVMLDADLYGLFTEWKTPDRLLVVGKGVTAWVELQPTTLEVKVTLPWLFRLAKGMIGAEVADKMQAVLAKAEAAAPATAPASP